VSKACSRTAPQTGSRRTAGVIGHLDRERIRLGVDFRSRFIATRSENILAEFRWGAAGLGFGTEAHDQCRQRNLHPLTHVFRGGAARLATAGGESECL
jgi:hypothetical protein